jgi:hypothetical protein
MGRPLAWAAFFWIFHQPLARSKMERSSVVYVSGTTRSSPSSSKKDRCKLLKLINGLESEIQETLANLRLLLFVF